MKSLTKEQNSKMKDAFQNILTFGGHQKIKNAQTQYQETFVNYKALHDKYTTMLKGVNSSFIKLKASKKNALLKVRKINKITKSLTIREREILEKELSSEVYPLKKIEYSISIAENALNLSKGSLIGAFAGSGVGGTAWALVGTYGAASTGTAIGTLSGAAATNAGLAWFGGGSVSAGGLGMAGGQIVLGGLVAVPAIVLAGLYQRWQANKKVIIIKEEGIKIIKYIDDINKNIEIIYATNLRIDELIRGLGKSVEIFEKTYNEIYKEIYPYGILSKFWKWLLRKFGKKSFTENELEKIMNLGKITGQVLKIIDTKII